MRRHHLKGQDNIVKVIASQIRKGNVVEDNDQLSSCSRPKASSRARARPPPRSTCAASRDGVKTSHRYKTTEQVERAFIETKEYTYPL